MKELNMKEMEMVTGGYMLINGDKPKDIEDQKNKPEKLKFPE